MKFGRSFLGASERSLQFVLNLFRNTCSTWQELSIFLFSTSKVLLVELHDTLELHNANPIARDTPSPSGLQRQFFSVRFLLFNENHISRVLFSRTIVKSCEERVGLLTNKAARKVWRWPLSWEFAARVVVILAEQRRKGERATRGWTLGKLPYWQDSRWHVKVVILSVTNGTKW